MPNGVYSHWVFYRKELSVEEKKVVSVSDAMKQKDPFLYFIFSEEQKALRKGIEEKMSRNFVPGTVIVNGVRHRYTEMNTTGKLKYPDSRIVASGLQSVMMFTPVSVTPK